MRPRLLLLAASLTGCEPPARDCVIAGEHYAHGESYSDGCNSHGCEDGSWWVTEKACGLYVPRETMCVPICPVETDPTIIAAHTDCYATRMDRVDAMLLEWWIPACEGGSEPRVPDGYDECFVLRMEAGADTPWPHDDISPACIEMGAAYELSLVTRSPIRWRGELSVSCRLIDPETGWARPMELCDSA